MTKKCISTALRADFPILQRIIHNHPLCYLDNAATTQKPQAVIDAITHFYTHDNATVGRGIYILGEQATILYEAARAKVQQFIGADDISEIIFTSGATEGINYIASTWALQYLKPHDEIVLTELEHHANLVPWQAVAQQTGATIHYIPINPDGSLNYATIPTLITDKTKLVAITHSSNALGTIIDLGQIIPQARHVGAKILIDASQSVPHKRINVAALDIDFLVFSGHKMLGPTGIGVLYIRQAVQHEVTPYQKGGGMVLNADWYTADWVKAPHKFEAGTPPIAQAVGLAAAITYLETINFTALAHHEAALCSRLIDGLQRLPYVHILGPIDQLRTQGHLVSFVINGMHAHDVAAYLDHQGICVRAGNHCAQPLANKLTYNASVRASFYLYNTFGEVDTLINAITALSAFINNTPELPTL